MNDFNPLGYLEHLAKQELEVFLYCERKDERFLLTIETTDGIIGTGENLTKACEDHFMAQQWVSTNEETL